MTTTGALAPTTGPRSCGQQGPIAGYPVYWSFYVLRCSDGSLYAGVARDMRERLKQHQAGKGSKYVRSRLPCMAVLSELVDGHSEALKKEAAFKKLTKAKKEEVIYDHVYERGGHDCYQDSCEGCAWSSVGGGKPYACDPPKGGVYVRPRWITEYDQEAYFAGYRKAADGMGWKETP